MAWAKAKAEKPEKENSISNNILSYFFLAASMAAFLFIISPLSASINGFVELNSTYDDNPFLEQELNPGFVIAPNFGLGYFSNDVPFGISSNVKYYKFTEFNSRNYLYSNILASYEIPITSEILFSPKLSYSLRYNDDETNFYNYNQFLSNLNIEYSKPNFNLQFSYIPRVKNYDNFNEISFAEHQFKPEIYFKINEKNAFYLDIEANAKIFTNRYNEDVIEMVFPKGKHKGRNQNDTSKNIYQPGIVNYDNNASAINLYLSYIRNVTSTSGFSISIYYNTPLSQNNASILSGTSDLISDPELFDDEYSYSEISPMLAFSKLFGFWMLNINAEWRTRKFIYTIDEFLENGVNDLREDQRLTAEINFGRVYSFNDHNTLEFNLSYSFTKNISNINFFNFSNNIISLSTRLTF